MVEIMKIMVNSFKRSHACTVAHSAPDPVAGHRHPRLCWRLQDTHRQVSQSLVGLPFLSPGLWCTQGFVCALQESVSQSCVGSDGSMAGLMANSSKRAYVIPSSAAPRAPAPATGHC